MRETISFFFFTIAHGNSFYIQSTNTRRLIALGLFVAAFIIIKYSPKLNQKIYTLASLGIGLVVAINASRYFPFGGDASIYCNLVSTAKSNNISIYDIDTKYTFNYPPIYQKILSFFCNINYESYYEYFYYSLLLLIGFAIHKQFSNNLLFVYTIIFSSFLSFRWILKTGNFVFLEVILLYLTLYYIKKENNLSIVFFILFAFQRVWFLSLIPILLFVNKGRLKEKLVYAGVTFAVMIPVNLIEFNGFIENIFSGNSQYSIWSEMPSHNTPSIGLLVYKYFNLENGFALIVIHFLLLQALLFYALRKDKLDPLTFFSFCLMVGTFLNPYLKPYLLIIPTVALACLDQEKLNKKRYVLVSCIYPNLFWIIGSMYPMGNFFSYHQTIFLALFISLFIKDFYKIKINFPIALLIYVNILFGSSLAFT